MISNWLGEFNCSSSEVLRVWNIRRYIFPPLCFSLVKAEDKEILRRTGGIFCAEWMLSELHKHQIGYSQWRTTRRQLRLAYKYGCSLQWAHEGSHWAERSVGGAKRRKRRKSRNWWGTPVRARDWLLVPAVNSRKLRFIIDWSIPRPHSYRLIVFDAW